MSAAPLLAFACAALGVVALAGFFEPLARARLPLIGRELTGLIEAALAIGREGRDPGAAERRRLLLAGGLVAMCGGWVLLGWVPALVLGLAGPWAVARLLAARRARYRRAVDEEAGAIAVALAGALSGGHSLRAAVAEAALAVTGPAGHEVRRAAAELEAGAPTGTALASLRERVSAPRIDALVAACLVQHAAGGDLALLLRECAESFGDQSRLEDEVRAATAQARFTGLIVVLMPLGGACLAELASPGFVAGLFSSLLSAWLVGLAVIFQAVAMVAIRKLGTVRW